MVAGHVEYAMAGFTEEDSVMVVVAVDRAYIGVGLQLLVFDLVVMPRVLAPLHLFVFD